MGTCERARLAKKKNLCLYIYLVQIRTEHDYKYRLPVCGSINTLRKVEGIPQPLREYVLYLPAHGLPQFSFLSTMCHRYHIVNAFVGIM